MPSLCCVLCQQDLFLWTDRWDHERRERCTHAGSRHVRVLWGMSEDQRKGLWMRRDARLSSLELGGDSHIMEGVRCPMQADELWLLLPDRPLPLQGVCSLFLQRIPGMDDAWLQELVRRGCGSRSLTSLTLAGECLYFLSKNCVHDERRRPPQLCPTT